MNELSATIPMDIRTPTGFDVALRTMEPLPFASAVSSLTEAERKKLSKVAQDSFREYRNSIHRETIEGLLLRRFQDMGDEGTIFLLGLLAVAPKSAAVQLMMFESLQAMAQRTADSRCDFELAAIQILKDRRPDWANEWLVAQLNSEFFPAIKWSSIQDLIQSGVCERPLHRSYLNQFGFNTSFNDFVKQPKLLEVIWQFFKLETQVFEYWNDKVTSSLPNTIIDQKGSGASEFEIGRATVSSRSSTSPANSEFRSA